MENVAVNSLEVFRVTDALQMVRKLVEGKVGAIRGNHVPPRGSSNGGSADVSCLEKWNYGRDVLLVICTTENLLPTAM